MSRTDKDLPYWVAEYYTPHHNCSEYGLTFWSKHRAEKCDLSELTYKELRKGGYWGNRRASVCYWTPVHPLGTKHWYDVNPGWWFHQVWLEPERARVRDQSRKALQDYNANGDTDVDIPDFRKKHNGGWYW